MITSTQNAKIKWLRSLQAKSRARRQAGAFVVEGVRLVEEALTTGWIPQFVLYSEDLSLRGLALIENITGQGMPLEKATPHVMRAASDTQTPQGILAVLPMRSLPLPAALNLVFIADGVRDPGNLGTMLRTSAAAGVDAFLLPERSVDVYSPKVVRAGMGAHFRLPVLDSTWEKIYSLVKSASLKIYLADTREGQVYHQADLSHSLALIVGGEAEGASESARNLAEKRLFIPMPGEMESLNAGIAAGILLFEIARQRST